MAMPAAARKKPRRLRHPSIPDRQQLGHPARPLLRARPPGRVGPGRLPVAMAAARDLLAKRATGIDAVRAIDGPSRATQRSRRSCRARRSLKCSNASPPRLRAGLRPRHRSLLVLLRRRWIRASGRLGHCGLPHPSGSAFEHPASPEPGRGATLAADDGRLAPRGAARTLESAHRGSARAPDRPRFPPRLPRTPSPREGAEQIQSVSSPHSTADLPNGTRVGSAPTAPVGILLHAGPSKEIRHPPQRVIKRPNERRRRRPQQNGQYAPGRSAARGVAGPSRAPSEEATTSRA
jgi:hypothetical protein